MSLDRYLEIREDPSQPLFHYTSVSKLPSILTSGALWATDVQYMNDAREFTHGISVLGRVLDERLPNLSGPQRKCAEQLRLWSSEGAIARHHIFATCFTEKGNILSQWRSYCSPGKGISLGFAPDELVESVYLQDLRLARVIYDRPDQFTIMGYLVDSILESSDGYTEPGPDQAHPSRSFSPLFREWEDTIATVCVMIKDRAFAEEHEWRAISAPIQDLRDPRFRFRDESLGLTPYIELELPKNGIDGVSFEKIFLGPSTNHNLAFRAVGTLLTSKKATVIQGLHACQIPLRT